MDDCICAASYSCEEDKNKRIVMNHQIHQTQITVEAVLGDNALEFCGISLRQKLGHRILE